MVLEAQAADANALAASANTAVKSMSVLNITRTLSGRHLRRLCRIAHIGRVQSGTAGAATTE